MKLYVSSSDYRCESSETALFCVVSFSFPLSSWPVTYLLSCLFSFLLVSWAFPKLLSNSPCPQTVVSVLVFVVRPLSLSLDHCPCPSPNTIVFPFVASSSFSSHHVFLFSIISSCPASHVPRLMSLILFRTSPEGLQRSKVWIRI